MDDPYPTFASAVDQFRRFLLSQDWPTQITWITSGQVRRVRRQLGVRLGQGASGEARAAGIYDRAVAARMGVLIEGVCRNGDRTYARVVRPLTEDASINQLYPDGVKLAVPAEPLDAVFVRSGLRWWTGWARGECWPADDNENET